MFGTMDPFGRAASWPYSTISPNRSTYPFSHANSSTGSAQATKVPTTDASSTDQNSRFSRVPDVSPKFFKIILS